MQRQHMTRRSGAFSVLGLVGALASIACDADDEGRPMLDEDERIVPAADPRDGAGEGVITPVLFIPFGESVDADQVVLVESALGDVWGWYDRELGDRHLRVDNLQIVYGQHDAATYRAGSPDIWGLGPDELRGALGFSPWDGGHVVLLVGAGLEGWAGGGGNGSAGFAVLGLESLANTSRCEGNWWCNPEVWRGTAIHELGHALTLPHSVDPSIMSFHGDWQARNLINEPDYPEYDTVRALPFVAVDFGPAEPDPDPDPEPESESGCGDVDYSGYCADGVLVWCESDAVQTFDCENVGMTCGWQDDVVGNNCL